MTLPENPDPQVTKYSHLVTALEDGKEYAWRVTLWMVTDGIRMRVSKSVPGPNTPYGIR